MLGKLLKHEFRATGRIMLPLLGLVLVLALLAGISANILDSGVESDLLNIMSALFITGFGLGLFAAMVVAFVLMIQRFYKNLMGDEGYLMFTLPVSIDQHIFSKLIVSSIWFAVAGLVCGLSMLILMLCNVESMDLGLFFRGFDGLTDYISVGNILAFGLEAVVLFFAFSFAVCLHIYAAVSIGHAFSNHKVLLSVVAYLVISFLFNALQLSLAALADKLGLLEYIGAHLSTTGPETYAQYIQFGHLAMLAFILYMLFQAALYYIPTRLMMKHRLNLA